MLVHPWDMANPDGRLTKCLTRIAFALVLNPHQRCGYSNLPFARIHHFHTVNSRNLLEGGVLRCDNKITIRKKHMCLFCGTCGIGECDDLATE